MPRILVVEDEDHLAEGLRFNLEADGHAVDIEGDGDGALERLLAGGAPYDAVILDVMLPGRNGFEVVHALREAGQYVPVLMLTARGRPEDVLQGFEAGADDYLPKPFELAILLARVRGLLRRRQWAREAASAAEAPRVLTFHGRTLDLAALELHVGDKTYHLTQMEVDLLAYLIRNAGKAVSRKAILEDVWALHEDTDTRAIDNFIVRLRRYLEDDPTKPALLLTVRGVGYKMAVDSGVGGQGSGVRRQEP
ncbi:MAG: response regulator transcription factor [Acidobacteria bacterium]|nr:response regulator transcription factor [Acidobacteriota bacterium]